MDMTFEELVDQVARLNAYLRERPWFDFDVGDCSFVGVTLTGGLDTSGGVEPEVVIRFEGIFYVSLLMAWRTDTSRTVLAVLDGDEARRLNVALCVEEGHHLVRFQPEDYDADSLACLVAARSMTWRSRPAGR